MHWTLAVLSLVWALPARADEPSAADVAAARQLAVEGIRLANAGDCKAAVEKLSRAQSLHPAPTILGRLGECQVALGKLVEGTENLRQVVREPLTQAPAAFVKARARAERVLAASAPRVAHLHIVVDAPPDAKVALMFDGEPVRAELVGADRPTDPGPHVVEATARGYLKTSENVTLLDGAATTVTIVMKADPNARDLETPPDAAARPPRSAGPSRAPAAIALAAGGVGLAVGGIFGAIALGKRSDLDAECNAAKVCPSSSQGTLGSLQTTSTVSTVAFIVGGVGVAAGVVLLFVPSAHPARAEQGLTLRPVVGPTGAGITGSF